VFQLVGIANDINRANEVVVADLERDGLNDTTGPVDDDSRRPFTMTIRAVALAEIPFCAAPITNRAARSSPSITFSAAATLAPPSVTRQRDRVSGRDMVADSNGRRAVKRLAR
jgi:hypothetical protein